MEAMDFMDPRRRRRYTVQLMVGYVLIGIAIILFAIVLMFVAYGFGYKNGQVIQNGLVLLSSTPNPAEIYIDGSLYKNKTNTRLIMPAGTYDIALKRAGYRNWDRTVQVEGGAVESFTYPTLFPLNLTTSTVREYATAPAFTTQSPDARWLLVAQPRSLTAYDVFDLTDVKKAPTLVTLPDGLLSPAASSQSLQLVEWASDNDHILLQHTYGGSVEYILVDRGNPGQSVNLTKQFGLPAASVDLRLSNQRFDQYLLYDTASRVLSRLQLGTTSPQPYVDNVLAFKTFGDNMVLYATPSTTVTNKVDIKLSDRGATYLIHTFDAGSTYLLDVNNYSGDLFVATASQREGLAYVYRDPETQIQGRQASQATPVQVFRMANPTYLSFSPGSHYVVFENGTNFAVFDTDLLHGSTYTVPDSIDDPQAHVYWMDGARLDYVSHGQIIVFDYDGANRQVLVTASAQYQPHFTPDFKLLYAFVPSVSDKSHQLLTSTPLRTPADL